MIISLQNSEFLVQKILIIMSYFISIPLLGAFRSWVNARMGDDTGEQLGFSTLNPVAHISLFWVFILLVIPDIPFGFGQYIPINPGAITGKWRRLKLAFSYFSDSLFGMLISVIVLLFAVVIYQKSPIELFMNFGVFRYASYYAPVEQISSFALVSGFFLMRLVIFNSMLAAFSVIINFFYMTFVSYFLSKNSFPDYADWIMLFGPFVLLILFQSFIYFVILKFVLIVATLISTLFCLI